jgi:hypothetical protein
VPIETTRIRYQLGNIDGPGNFFGLLCDAQTDYDKDTGEWVLTGDGATGRGETLVIASLLWIMDRLKVQLPNAPRDLRGDSRVTVHADVGTSGGGQ